MMLLAAEGLPAGKAGTLGRPDIPVGQDQLGRTEHQRQAIPGDAHCPLACLLVIGRARRLGTRPVVELHDVRVGLEPVGDLVLGGDRPASFVRGI